MSLEKILSKVENAKKDSGRQNDKVNVIAVSKVQPIARIKKVLIASIFAVERSKRSIVSILKVSTV